MRFLIPALILTIAATAATPAAGEKNIGLLLEWIQVDHKSANQLLHLSAGEENANVLRETLEGEIDAGKATLLETSYLVTAPGMRAKVESSLEHIYPAEYDPPMIVCPAPPKFRLPKVGDISPGVIDITPTPTAHDIRDLGTTLEIEPNIGRDGKLQFNIEATRTEHLVNLIFSDPQRPQLGTFQPLFRELQTSTTFISNDGEDFLIDVLTPKNNSDQRIFLIARANILRANRIPDADLIGFTKLPPGSTLTVDHHSDGCFHDTATRYEFTGKRVTISQLEPKLVKQGTVTLTDADLKKLDQTLAFYRDAPGGGCTTVEEITLKLRQGEKVIAFENYIDGTCTIDEQKGLIQFGALDLRLKKAQP